MELDFSKLNSIPEEPRKEDDLKEEPLIQGKALISLTEDQKNRNRVKAVYKEYQENIKLSEALRVDILKGLRAGEAPEDLLLKACKAIALMTHDRGYIDQVEKLTMKAVK